MEPDEISRLRRAISRLARQFNATATHEGLTPAQASILGVIVARGPLGLAELVEIEGVHPTMLSRVIGKLSAAGLIERDQHPDDLRAVTVKATAAGRKTQGRISAERAAIMGRYVAMLSPAQERQLVAALPALEVMSAVAGTPA